MDRRRSWEPHSLSRTLWNPRVHYRIHKCASECYLNIQFPEYPFFIVPSFTLKSDSWNFSLRFRLKVCVKLSSPPVLAALPDYKVFLQYSRKLNTFKYITRIACGYLLLYWTLLNLKWKVAIKSHTVSWEYWNKKADERTWSNFEIVLKFYVKIWTVGEHAVA